MNKSITSAFCAAVTFYHLLAGPALADDPIELDDLLVTATRWETEDNPTAANIRVITRQDIERSGARNLSEVLRGQGGVQIQDLFGDGSRTVVDMRGFGLNGGANTLILVDGRRLNNSDASAPRLNTIFLEDVERIEIVRGAGTVLYGDQAVGGVINIITRTTRTQTVATAGGGGSYDSWNAGVRIADRLENGFAYRVSAEYDKSDGYRDNNDSQYLNGFVNLSWETSWGKLFAEYQGTDEDLGIPGTLFADELAVSRTQTTKPGDFNDSSADIFRVGGHAAFGEGWKIGGEYTYRDEETDGALTSFGAIYPLAQDRVVQSFNPRIRGSFAVGAGKFSLVAGADFDNYDYTLESPFGIQDTDQDVHSYYAIATMPLAPEFSVTAGLRYASQETDLVDGFRFFPGDKTEDDQTAFSIGAVYAPSDSWRLDFRFEEVYRFPLVDEETNVFGTPDTLETQTGESWELGLGWLESGWEGRLVAYLLELENEIVYDSKAFMNINLDPTRRKGLIAELGWDVSERLSLDAQYTWTDAEFSVGPYDGHEVPLVAENQLRLSANYAITGQWNLYGEFFTVGDRVAGNDFLGTFPELDGYELVNLHLHYDSGRFEVSARVNNLLDEEYSDSAAVGLNAFFIDEVGYYPAPERNFFVSLGFAIR